MTGAHLRPASTALGGGQPLLAAAVPVGKQLRTLALHGCELGVVGMPSVLLGPHQWAQLLALELNDCLGPRSMDAVLNMLLSSAPQLRRLQFRLCGPVPPRPEQRLRAFPAALFSHPSLIAAKVCSLFEEQEWDSLELPPLPNPREPAAA